MKKSLLFLWVVFYFAMGPASARGAVISPSASAPEAVKADGVSSAVESGSDAIDPLSARDPFEDAFPKEGTSEFAEATEEMSAEEAPPQETFDPSKFSVTGLVWGLSESRAIINGQIVGVGSEIEGATIEKIDKEGILLDCGGQKVLLTRNMGAENVTSS